MTPRYTIQATPLLYVRTCCNWRIISDDLKQGFVSPYFSSHTKERLLANTLSTTSSNKDYHSLAAIQSTSTSSQAVDILLSNAWPSLIMNSSTCPIPPKDLLSVLAPPLDDVVRRIQPRYHFVMGAADPPTFWEREPFTWDGDEARVTRFVSLGAFGGEAPSTGKKQRVRFRIITLRGGTDHRCCISGFTLLTFRQDQGKVSRSRKMRLRTHS